MFVSMLHEDENDILNKEKSLVNIAKYCMSYGDFNIAYIIYTTLSSVLSEVDEIVCCF